MIVAGGTVPKFSVGQRLDEEVRVIPGTGDFGERFLGTDRGVA
ncbi:hypothetical protein [Streptomyces mobaraensis]|uniref:Uncharacterized protein n=1 Tax=Streptomyces mobaraensis (strain ATCC 29032 / DSM 40847 / JCM 4168 / NBRC 13819 / NCIMB 11159 / IPCR 16-22) TaxID=1223523 RepID=M3CDL2_STRM1|nr:hypothetical protein [Streptomyces mobaraensis]EMF02086.1 hypothetical protein H340_02614 [Streptomyces mobaraensis NBRC 13819 = DSM 40847]